MIYDTLTNAELYLDMQPLLAEAFLFLSSFDPATPDGRIELQGNDLFVNVERYTTEPAETRRYEAHRAYLDVQTIFTGREVIYVNPLDRLTVTEPYDAKRDVAFFTGPDTQQLELTPGDFAMFFPQDGHKPCCQTQSPNEVLKVVVKMRLDAAL